MNRRREQTRGGTSALGLEGELKSPDYKTMSLLWNVAQGSVLEPPIQREIGRRFGTWNIKKLYKVVSLKTETNQPTNAMEQSPWRANSHSNTHLLWHLMFHYRVYKKNRFWSPWWTTLIQSTTSHPISLRLISILYPHLHLVLTSFLFLQVFRTKIVYFIFLICVLHATPI